MDISNEIIRFTTDIGVRKEEDLISFDGKLNLTIKSDNIDIVNLYKKDLLVKVEIKDPRDNSWKSLYTGFTDRLKFVLGIRTKTVTIECLQGIGKFRNITIDPTLSNFKRIDEVISILMENKLIQNPFNLDNYVDDIIFQRPKTFIGEIDDSVSSEGVSTYELIGSLWTQDTTLNQALLDLLNAELARLWVSRAGIYEFRNFRKFFNYGYDFTIIRDSEIVNNTIDTKLNKYNNVSINWLYKKPGESGKTDIWSLDYLYKIPANSNSVPLKMALSFPNNQFFDVLEDLDLEEINIKVFNLNLAEHPELGQTLYSEFLTEVAEYEEIEDNTDPRPIFEPFRTDRVDDLDDTTDSDFGGVSYVISKHNNINYITFYNSQPSPVWITVSGVRGRSFQSFQNTFDFNNFNIPDNNVKNITNSIMSLEKQGKRIADYHFIKGKEITNKLKTITIKSASLEQLYKIIDITLGSYLQVNGQYYIIIGEKINSNRTILEVTYTLAKMPDIDYMSSTHTKLPGILGL